MDLRKTQIGGNKYTISEHKKEEMSSSYKLLSGFRKLFENEKTEESNKEGMSFHFDTKEEADKQVEEWKKKYPSAKYEVSKTGFQWRAKMEESTIEEGAKIEAFKEWLKSVKNLDRQGFDSLPIDKQQAMMDEFDTLGKEKNESKLNEASNLIKVKSITITRGEGPTQYVRKPVTVSSYEEADKVLRTEQFALTAPKEGGGYDKTDFKIVFQDGEEYEGRLDIKHPSASNNDLDVAKHVYDHSMFYSGLQTKLPSHIKSQEVYKSVIGDEKSQQSYRELLAKYDLKYNRTQEVVKDEETKHEEDMHQRMKSESKVNESWVNKFWNTSRLEEAKVYESIHDFFEGKITKECLLESNKDKTFIDAFLKEMNEEYDKEAEKVYAKKFAWHITGNRENVLGSFVYEIGNRYLNYKSTFVDEMDREFGAKQVPYRYGNVAENNGVVFAFVWQGVAGSTLNKESLVDLKSKLEEKLKKKVDFIIEQGGKVLLERWLLEKMQKAVKERVNIREAFKASCMFLEKISNPRVLESKVNEEEMGNQDAPVVPPKEEPMVATTPEETIKDEPKEEEKPLEEPKEDSKLVLAQKGEQFFYINDDGTNVTITDALGKEVAKGEVSDIVNFLKKALRDLGVSNINFSAFEKYVLPKDEEEKEEDPIDSLPPLDPQGDAKAEEPIVNK